MNEYMKLDPTNRNKEREKRKKQEPQERRVGRKYWFQRFLSSTLRLVGTRTRFEGEGRSMVACQRRRPAGSKSCGGKVSKEEEATPIRQLDPPLTLNHSLISH